MKKMMAAVVAATATISAMAATVDHFVEYIETSGNQYVLLEDYKPTCNSIVEAEVAILDKSLAQCFFCSRGNTTTTKTFTSFWLGGNGIRWDYNRTTAVYAGKDIIEGEKVSLKFANNGLWINGENTGMSVTPADYTPANKMILFASYTCAETATPKATDNYAKMRLYSFKAYDDNGETLKVDLRPCVDSDGNAGLCDFVSGTIYYNKGTTPFDIGDICGEGVVYVKGLPQNYAAAGSPVYGVVEKSPGEAVKLTAPEYVELPDDGARAYCTGWKLYDIAGKTLLDESDAESRLTCSFEYSEPVRLVWQWDVRYPVTVSAAAGLTVTPESAWSSVAAPAEFTVAGADVPYWSGEGLLGDPRAKTVAVAPTAATEISVKAADVREPTDIEGLKVAIASSKDGDVVILPDGTNSFAAVTQDEMTNELAITKAVLVTSRSGDPKDVTIDLGGTGYGFTLTAPGARLRGITFTSSVAVKEDSGTHPLPRFVNVVAGTVDACVFRDVKITGNKYGGFAPVRLYAGGAIDNCLFTNISCSVAYPNAPHGTVYATGGVISNSQFVACNTPNAPLVIAGGTATIYVEDSLFCNADSGSNSSGAIYATGGSTTFPRALIRRTTVANNKAGTAGVAHYGGGDGFKPLTFEDCVFTNNSAGVGVISGDERANYTCDRCLIVDNVGNSHGVTPGGYKAASIFRNCLIRGNCGKSTAGVAAPESDIYRGLQFENCTVTGNRTESGSVGGISIKGCGNTDYKTWVKNCIVWGNTGPGNPVQLTVDEAKVFSSCYPEADPENVNGNISGNPWLNADGTLQYTSPCLDVALDLTSTAGATDLVGTERPQDATGKGAIWDMGCFEMPPNTEPLVVSVSIDQTVGASPATVTATAEVAGAKTSGLTYDWMIVCTAPNVSTNVEKDCTDASHAFANLAPGAYEISVTVKNDSGDSATVRCEQGFSAKPAVCYVSKTGSATWPYDAPERATPSFADAIANAARRVEVLTGEYDLSGWTELLEIPSAVEVVSASGNAADVVLDLGGTGCGFTLNNAGAKIGNVTFVSSATMNDSADLTLPRFVNVIAGTVEGCVFRDVTLGGTNSKGSYPVKLLSAGAITGCVFSNFVNTVSSPKQGGVIFSQGGLVSNCNFIACNAYRAPIVVSGGYAVYVEDCLFTGVDSTATTCGALYGIGGNLSEPRAVFRRTTVANNKAGTAGVAYYSSSDSGNKPMKFEDCVLANNTATSGIGVFYCTEKAPINCTRCLIADNVGASQGVICDSIYVTHIFRNCLICGNTGKSTAGVVSGSSGRFNFESCTVTENKTETGAVAGINIAGCGTTANTWVKNCVVWGNAGPEGAVQLNADAAKVSYSCYPEADPANANGNTPDDPKLRTVKRYRYYPSPAGSCYEAGNATGWTVDDVDLSGAPRLRGGKIDIGCYQAVPLPGLLLMLK